MFKSFLLELNISAVQTNYIFSVNSNDLNTIRLDLVIKDNAALVDLTGKIVRLAIRKPDHTVVFQSGGVTDGPGGKCEFILSKQAALVPGRHEGEVMIYEGDSTVAVTTKFYYEVKRAVLTNEAVESSSDFPAISQAIQAGEILKEIDIHSVIEAGAIAGGVQTEMNLAKQKEDGTLFGTVQERLNDSDEKTAINTADLADIANVTVSITDKRFGAKSDGTDQSSQMQSAVDYVASKGGGLVIIPYGKFRGNITISKSNVHIGGAGTIQGMINLYGNNTNGMSRFDPIQGVGDISVKGITIDGEKLRNGINNKWVFGVTIQGVIFKNCVKSINFEPVSESQHCSRFTINSNRFWDCNYGLYVDYDPTNAAAIFQVGDITFTSNVIESRNSGWAGPFGNIYHIWARGLDGLVCDSNTFFFSKVGSEITNIYLDNFNWVIIKGNQLFEAKEYGIKATNGQNLTVTDNNFAWTAKESVWVSNITTCSVNDNVFSWKDDGTITANRTGVYVEECPFFIGTINDNKFYFPNEHAVKIKNSSNITINDNTARNKFSTLEPIKIDSFATCGNINMNGNTFTGFSKTLESNLATLGTNSTISFNGNNEGKAVINRGVHSPMYKSYSGNETSIDFSNANLIVLANTTATTISSITTENLSNTFPRVVTLYSYNSNTTLSTTIPNMTLKVAPNNTTVNIPANESITFLVYGGSIRELSRSFQMANRVRTISDTSTTADMTSFDQINFNQSAPATFTGITGTFTDGKIIDMIGFTGNTTIANTVANLKGAVNVVLPNKGLLRLKYTSGNWYEVARNF